MFQAIKGPTQSGTTAAPTGLGEGNNDIDKMAGADASRSDAALDSSWHDPATAGLADLQPHALLARDLPALARPADDPVARPLASIDFGILPAQIVARVTSSPRQPVVGQTSDT